MCDCDVVFKELKAIRERLESFAPADADYKKPIRRTSKAMLELAKRISDEAGFIPLGPDEAFPIGYFGTNPRTGGPLLPVNARVKILPAAKDKR